MMKIASDANIDVDAAGRGPRRALYSRPARRELPGRRIPRDIFTSLEPQTSGEGMTVKRKGSPYSTSRFLCRRRWGPWPSSPDTRDADGQERAEAIGARRYRRLNHHAGSDVERLATLHTNARTDAQLVEVWVATRDVNDFAEDESRTPRY
jgi:hypothetical protein